MNQKSTHGWIIWSVLSFFLWSIIGFVAFLLPAPVTSTTPIFMVIYWVSGIIGLAVVLALENEYPSFRSGVKGFVLVMMVFFLLDIAMYGFVTPPLYNQNPHFQLIVTSYTDQYPTSYTFYAKIRNEGSDGSQVVTCMVTKANLNTVSKSQTVYLRHDEERDISFTFSEWEVGTPWKEYTVKIGS